MRPRRPALIVLLATSACAEALISVSDGPTAPAAKVDQFAEALAARYTNPERSGRFESTRRRLVGGALNPSRILADSTLWSGTIAPSTRVLSARGGLTDRGYRFDVAPERLALTKPGDTRHFITLRPLGNDEFRWNTSVDFAIGSLTAADVGVMIERLLTASHGRDPAVARASARSAFPRSTVVLSRLFAVDSLTLRPGSQGTTTVSLWIGVHTEILRKSAPHFADYVARYMERARFHGVLADRSGAQFFDIRGGDKKLTVTYRVSAGSIVSAFGTPRPLPDSLRLTSDLTMRVKMFDVGWSALMTDFTIARTDHSRSWSIAARKEPEWHLPLITSRLLRTPLRRPFQGAGSSLELSVSDSAGRQSLLSRRAQLEVKESAILRFLSGLVSRVFDDLDAAVEREEAAFLRELMIAFQQDAKALLVR